MYLHAREAEALHAVLTALLQGEAGGVSEGEAAPEGVVPGRILVEEPREAKFGDFSSNLALVLAPKLGRKPRELAEALAEGMAAREEVAQAGVAGPGFLNWRLTAPAWQEVLRAVLSAPSPWPFRNLGEGKGVNVEFVSANPTGPLTIAHARGAVLGDAAAELLQRFGWRVEREYYVNDAGGQIETLAETVLLRMREAKGEEVGEVPEGWYPGSYLKPVGAALAAREEEVLGPAGEDAAAQKAAAGAFAVEEMMRRVREDLAGLGVEHDVFSSDRAFRESGAVERAVEALKERGHVYRGVLEPPKGEEPEGWEPREQLLFRATSFGDVCDRPLQRSSGAWTYFAADIAYHYDKHLRSGARLIDVLGADHAGYVKRIGAAVEAVSGGAAHLEVVLCQIVRLLRGGEEVRMSKRSGEFVTLREVLDEVGADALRFMVLTRKPSAPLDFDLEAVKRTSLGEPGLLCAVRACALLFGDAACCGGLPRAGARTGGLGGARFGGAGFGGGAGAYRSLGRCAESDGGRHGGGGAAPGDGVAQIRGAGLSRALEQL